MAEEIYRSIRSMEPMLPQAGGAELADLSVEIFRKSGELDASLPSRVVRQEVAGLVCGMNSYYSNLIEEHKTLPMDIEKALRNEFSGCQEDRVNQRLSVAHIRAERSMRRRLEEDPDVDVHSAGFLQWLHREFYQSLPEEEWYTTTLSGVRHPLVPGAFRDHPVSVGRHVPPDHPVLEAYLERFRSFHSDGGIPATHRLVAIAAAHHRLAWIHPFGDGNGRVARLQSQAALIRAGLDREGLWTLSRGLSRTRSTYFRLLQEADGRRMNDFDGRGNPSDAALARFCGYFLRQILDQIEFMIGLIQPFQLMKRMEHYFRFVRLDLDERMRARLAKLIGELCLRGEIPRGAVPEILGVGGTVARDVIRKALAEGLVTSSTEKSALRIVFSDKVTPYYFPLLFQHQEEDG